MMCRIYLLYVVLVLIVTVTDLVWSGALECESDTDCINEATCTNNLCQCPDGYVFSTDGYRCLKHVIGYQAACEDDAQCSYLTGKYYCNAGACDCGVGYRYLHGRCVISKGLGESCELDEECHVTNHLNAMICSDGVCSCNTGYYARENYDCRPDATAINATCALDMDCKVSNTICDRYQCTTITQSSDSSMFNHIPQLQRDTNEIVMYAIGTSCTTSADCDDVPNSMCSPLTKECVCKRGYYLSSSTCVGEVGINVGCTQNSDCGSITPRTCQNGACVCPLTHYHNKALTGCVRIAYTPYFPCTQDMSCNIFGKEAICVEQGFELLCYCPLGYKLNEETYLCEVSQESGGNNCVVASDCTIVNGVCKDGSCTCDDYYRLEDNTCVPNIGGECDSDVKICDLENAACTDGICSCFANYTGVDEITCMQVANELGDNCEHDMQCSFVVPNSECSNGRCNCISRYSEKDGLCLEARGYGDYCVNLLQCQVALGENIQCRNSMCQCPAGMDRTNDGLDCRSRSKASSLKFSLFVFILLAVNYLM
ncbi:hypothetical protein Trydic_g18580 [Trypoxylus dichotomus]